MGNSGSLTKSDNMASLCSQCNTAIAQDKYTYTMNIRYRYNNGSDCEFTRIFCKPECYQQSIQDYRWIQSRYDRVTVIEDSQRRVTQVTIMNS